MKLDAKAALCAQAAQFGLTVEYVDDLPDNVCGHLDSRDEPRFIAVNRRLPECEQVFTIAHELAHYLLHHQRPRRQYHAWLLHRRWKLRPAALATRYARRSVYQFMTPEFEADGLALLYLLQVGAKNELQAYLQRHSDRLWLFELLVIFALPKALWRRTKAILARLFLSPIHLV